MLLVLTAWLQHPRFATRHRRHERAPRAPNERVEQDRLAVRRPDRPMIVGRALDDPLHVAAA
jgi:hypothetical protein